MSHNTTDNEEETVRTDDVGVKNAQWKMLTSKVSDGRSELDSLQVEFSSFDISKGKKAIKCSQCDKIQCECHWTTQGTAKNFMEQQGNDETGTAAANMIDKMEAVLDRVQKDMIAIKTAIVISICEEDEVSGDMEEVLKILDLLIARVAIVMTNLQQYLVQRLELVMTPGGGEDVNRALDTLATKIVFEMRDSVNNLFNHYVILEDFMESINDWDTNEDSINALVV